MELKIKQGPYGNHNRKTRPYRVNRETLPETQIWIQTSEVVVTTAETGNQRLAECPFHGGN